MSKGFHIVTRKVYFIEEDLIDVDIFRMQFLANGFFFKQNIVDALKNNNITGIEFKPIEPPILRYICWADTGLPVED